MVGLPSVGGAQDVDSLREQTQSLQAQERAAVLELYALESRLAGARAAVARVRAQRAELERQQRSAAKRFRIAKHTLRLAQVRLGQQLVLLYQSEEPDVIAILLGSTSLSAALDEIESLNRTARTTDDVIQRARIAKAGVTKERRSLRTRQRALREVQSRAEAVLGSLLATTEQKASYIARLRTQQQLNARQIAALEERARLAQQKAEEIAPNASTPAETSADDGDTDSPPPPTGGDEQPDESDPGTPQENPAESVDEPTESAPPSGPAPKSGQLRVVASAYCLQGTTATGLPVGPGIVAVDPSVIPLGTRMTIPGYGEGVAADTGGAIKGNRIDLWMGCPAANAYGLKTLTITLH